MRWGRRLRRSMLRLLLGGAVRIEGGVKGDGWKVDDRDDEVLKHCALKNLKRDMHAFVP